MSKPAEKPSIVECGTCSGTGLVSVWLIEEPHECPVCEGRKVIYSDATEKGGPDES